MVYDSSRNYQILVSKKITYKNSNGIRFVSIGNIKELYDYETKRRRVRFISYRIAMLFLRPIFRQILLFTVYEVCLRLLHHKFY